MTCSQLRQCLDCLGLECSDQEYDVIRTAFSDQKGVHYLDFLHELDPQELVVDKYRTKRTLIKELEKEKVRRRCRWHSTLFDHVSILGCGAERVLNGIPKVNLIKGAITLYPYMYLAASRKNCC